MGQIDELAEEAKGATGCNKKKSTGTDEEDSYDNDFEPFETSKKDFYQNESTEEKSEAKSDEETPAGASRIQTSSHVTPGQQRKQPPQVVVDDQAQPKPAVQPRLSTRSPQSRSPSGLSPDKWISIPALEEKFRFKLPLNCHMTKSITAAVTHASKITITAQKKLADGEMSIEFGLQMNDGPIDDTMSAHSCRVTSATSRGGARIAQRHANCKHSVSAYLLPAKMLTRESVTGAPTGPL